MRARPFHRQQHRPAPFAANADALKHAQDSQDNRSPYSDRLIGRHKGDQEGRDAHAEQRGKKSRLAADAIAVVTENGSTDRTSNKADEISAEGGERRRQRIGVWKVELAEHQSGS